MTSASVAVIIPVFNRPKIVLETLDSVAVQTMPPAKLLIVDDGSTDDTPARVEEWIAKARLPFPARLLRQPNSGAAAARNLGAAEAGDCEVLAFLDSDDLWPVDFVQRVGEAFARRTEAVAIACDRVNHDFATKQVEPHGYAHYSAGGEHAATIMFREGPPGTSGTAFRASTFRRAGGFDLRWPTGQDYDLMLRVSLLGQWLHLPGAPVTTRNHLEVLTGGGEPPLSRKYPDRAYRRVQMLDRFITELGGGAVVPEKLWRPRLAQLWYRAGRRLLALGRRTEARQCFRRTVELRPWHLLARARLLRTDPE